MTRVSDPRQKLQYAVLSNVTKIHYEAVLQIRAKVFVCLVDKVVNKNVGFVGPAFGAVLNPIACQSSRVLDREINWKSSLKYQTGISLCSVAIHCRQSKPGTKFFKLRF